MPAAPPARLSPQGRIRLQSRAEAEIRRYKDDHFWWHKHIHNVELDPVQVLKMLQMDLHPNTVDYSARRTGKTFCKECYGLKQNATESDQAWGIVAPREAQSIDNLNYHLEAIRRSPALKAYIGTRAGRPMLADTYYRFANRSGARAYGIMAQVDGGDLTAASLEEVDDMPLDRLLGRFLLMLGATRRAGAASGSRNEPTIRATGVFKGADTLAHLVGAADFHKLPIVDVYLGKKMGLLNQGYMDLMADQLSPEEYVRQLLCKNRAAQWLIHEKYVRLAMQVGIEAGIGLAPPLPGSRYRKRGYLAFGYDAGGHGEDPRASRHCLWVVEEVAGFVTMPYVRFWPSWADDNAVKRDLKSAWAYFRPDAALGDAYGVGMLGQLNDELYADGLTDIDRRAVAEGQSSASTWPDWAFSPIQFQGMTKHQMAQCLRAVFHHRQACLPYLDDEKDSDQEVTDMRRAVRQLLNVAPEPTRKGYSSYRMVDPNVGDDGFDALMAAVFALMTRGTGEVPGIVRVRTVDRDRLLGLPEPVGAR